MKKEKSIETPELLIKGNIMSWEETMIQLSNVSCISTAPLDQLEFPKMSIIILLLGIVIIFDNPVTGIILLTAGGIWIYVWHYINVIRKLDKMLIIIMNSGNSLKFIIGDRNFLNIIVQLLREIIIEGGIGDQNLIIKIEGCTIDGNARVLNNIKL